MRVGLVFGGRSAEHRISVVSARTIAAALAAGGHEVVPVGIGQDGSWQVAADGVRALAGEIDSRVDEIQRFLQMRVQKAFAETGDLDDFGRADRRFQAINMLQGHVAALAAGGEFELLAGTDEAFQVAAVGQRDRQLLGIGNRCQLGHDRAHTN